MNKQTAIALAGSAKALSDLLGINQSAISQWGDLIPELRMWQLKSLKPEWFDRLTADTTPTEKAAA